MVLPDIRTSNGDAYLYQRTLGAGGFGKSYLYRVNDKLLVFKLFYPQKNSRMYFQEEVNVYKTLSKVLGGGCRPSIICYYTDVLVTPGSRTYKAFYADMRRSNSDLVPNNTIYGVVSEYAGGETLQGVARALTADGKRYYNYQYMLKLIDTMLGVLNYIHSKNIAHRDIKPDNIVYDANTGDFTLIDFGIACINKCTWNAFTPGFVAPEVKAGIIDIMTVKNADYYSLGATLAYIANVTPRALHTGYYAIDAMIRVLSQDYKKGDKYIQQRWDQIKQLYPDGGFYGR